MIGQSIVALGFPSGRRLALALAAGILESATPVGRAAAQGMPAPLGQFLQQTASFTSQEMNAAAGGTPVVKVLESADHNELAFLGVVRIDVPRVFYVKGATNFTVSLREPSRRSFGMFTDPAAAADVAAFWLPHADVQDLAKCKPGSCMLKLPTRAIVQLSANIDPNSPSADTVASDYFRDGMVQYVGDYRLRGNEALVIYGDRPDSDKAAEVWGAMLSRSPYMYQYTPTLERYLRNYPHDRPEAIREVLFWSLDDYQAPMRPMLTITHQMVYEPPELPETTLIVAKQLYCDHYLNGGLDLTAVVDQTRGQSPGVTGIYLVVLRRNHFDNLPTGGLINMRATVSGKLRDRTVNFLRNEKTHNEHEYSTSNPSSK